MDIDILELKRQFYPLSTRRKDPIDNGCIENEMASKLFRKWRNRPNWIPVLPKDIIDFTLFFICECPDNEWKKLKYPDSLFNSKQVAPFQRNAIDEFAILGEDVALAYSLMCWYGSVEVYNVLLREWIFNLDE